MLAKYLNLTLIKKKLYNDDGNIFKNKIKIVIIIFINHNITEGA